MDRNIQGNCTFIALFSLRLSVFDGGFGTQIFPTLSNLVPWKRTLTQGRSILQSYRYIHHLFSLFRSRYTTSHLPHNSLSKLQTQITKPIKMAQEVRAAHLLIKHSQSRNPVSRRTGLDVTITPEEAAAELHQYMARIQAHPDGVNSFPMFARERSDCSSFRANGDLGFFGRGMMQKPFEDSAFALQVGQMSGLVSTDSGMHLIYRIA